MEEAYKKLLALIEKYGTEEKPISAKWLGEQLKIEQDANHGPIRGMVKKLRFDEGEAIGSRNRGYFIIENPAQEKKYRMHVATRLDGLRKLDEITKINCAAKWEREGL